MKKILLFTVFIFGFLSCSSDEESNSTIDPVNALPKKLVYTQIRNGETEIVTTYNFTYDGTKLTKVVQTAVQDFNNHTSSTIIEFEYAGDFVTKVKQSYSNGEGANTEYLYSMEGKLVLETRTLSTSQVNIMDYTYQTQGDLEVVIASFDSFPSRREKYSYKNGVKMYYEESGDHGSTYPGRVEYTYDDKKNPFEALVGLDKIHRDGIFNHDEIIMCTGANNLKSRIYNEGELEYEYEYNDSGYPVFASTYTALDNTLKHEID